MTRRLTSLLTTVAPVAAKAAAWRPPVWLAPNALGTGPAEMEILIADTTGRVIGEIQPQVQGVAWKLNNYGQVRLTVSRAEFVERPWLFRFGNRILFRFGNGLAEWGGVIDPPRKWNSERVSVVGYSGEYLLDWRVTDRGRYFNKATAGDIFRAVIREARDFDVALGYVWTGGAPHSPEYHFESIYDIVTRSITRRLEAVDWDVRPVLEDGRIRFVANLYERRGSDYSVGSALGRRIGFVEGINVTGSMDEQGPIVNDIYLAGSGSGWGEGNRIYSHVWDENSRALYDLRQGGETVVDISVQGTLDGAAALRLAEQSAPKEVYSLTAYDTAPARFAQYGVGDTVWLEMFSVGAAGREQGVRVVAQEYLPASNTCSLVVE